jgi:hypothetical protein
MKLGKYLCIGIMVCFGLVAVHQLVAGFVSVHKWPQLSPSDWGTWVGSIGTVATLYGTIRLATAETRRRERSEQLLARLHAAGMLLRLERAHEIVGRLAHSMAFVTTVKDIGPGLFAHNLKSLEEIELWDVADLVPLVPLPHNVASKLAQAADQIRTVKRLLSEAQRLRPVPPHLLPQLENSNARYQTSDTPRFLHEAAAQVLGILSVTNIFLRDAVIVCRIAPVKAYPVPPENA